MSRRGGPPKELAAKGMKRQQSFDKEGFQKAIELAKKKNVVLKDEPFKPGNFICKDCREPLPEPTWYMEEIFFFGKPMIKYWFIWSGLLQPVAYSKPTNQKKYICPGCFDDKENRKRRLSQAGPVEEAAKLTFQLMRNLHKVSNSTSDTGIDK